MEFVPLHSSLVTEWDSMSKKKKIVIYITIEYYAAIKKNEIISPAATRMELEANLLCEITQKQSQMSHILRVGTKQLVHLDIQKEATESHTGDSKRGEVERDVRIEKLSVEYNVHYSGDRRTKSPNLTIMQYIHVTNMHMYSLNL